MDNEFTVDVLGKRLEIHARKSLFSPSAPDRGTLAMLRRAGITEDDRVLDLGCGWGYVSLYASLCGAARVDACDVDENAVACTNENLVRAGFSPCAVRSDGLDATAAYDYTCILSNPPYQSDFSVAGKFIAGSYAHLAMGGRLIMVTKRRRWYKNRLIAVFGGVQITEDDGYFVFLAEKREKKEEKPENKRKLSRKLARKYGKDGR